MGRVRLLPSSKPHFSAGILKITELTEYKLLIAEHINHSTSDIQLVKCNSKVSGAIASGGLKREIGLSQVAKY